MAEFASKGVAGSGLGLGIAGTALGVLNGGLGNLLGGMGGWNTGCGWGGGWNRGAVPIISECNENMPVNRYEAQKDARIAELETEVKLRDANTYTDQKLLELYKYFDGKLDHVDHKLCDQAVWNTAQSGTINCMAGQIAQLYGLTKLVVPNSSICPGWGDVTVSVTPATTTTP